MCLDRTGVLANIRIKVTACGTLALGQDRRRSPAAPYADRYTDMTKQVE